MPAARVAHSLDPDQMPHSAASDLGLNCLLRLVQNLWINVVRKVWCKVVIIGKFHLNTKAVERRYFLLFVFC